MTNERTTTTAFIEREDGNDDASEIRYSLTALGETHVAERARTRSSGFDACSTVMLKVAG